jgi:hypothetical protein
VVSGILGGSRLCRQDAHDKSGGPQMRHDLLHRLVRFGLGTLFWLGRVPDRRGVGAFLQGHRHLGREVGRSMVPASVVTSAVAGRPSRATALASKKPLRVIAVFSYSKGVPRAASPGQTRLTLALQPSGLHSGVLTQ